MVDALRVSPETEKAQPELTDWAWFVVCGGMGTAYLRRLNDEYHLLSTDGFWMDFAPAESIR